MFNFVNTAEIRRWDNSFSIVPTLVICQPWPCRPFISNANLKELCSIMTQAGHKGKPHPVPWNAALALPGALPESRKGSEGWETGKSKCCSFIWQHRLLPAGSLARHKGCIGWGGNRKGQREGHGLTPNIWCAYEQISASIVSGKWNSLSLESSLKEYQIPNEHLPFSPQWPNIRPQLSPMELNQQIPDKQCFTTPQHRR